MGKSIDYLLSKVGMPIGIVAILVGGIRLAHDIKDSEGWGGIALGSFTLYNAYKSKERLKSYNSNYEN